MEKAKKIFSQILENRPLLPPGQYDFWTTSRFCFLKVVNIPGTNVNGGETISEYVGSAPPKGSGLHRYVFVLFKQPGKVKFEEPKHSATDGNRANFNTKNFAKKYNLGKPIAGNFFQAQWDEYVPQAHKKLGF
ncbi:unnamed protein product [Callosobruchus maculatus]|uniref:Phosphatidylethanolamine-binding protein n=1 Tax=Callosobruchus maculatus TaxID=64391 RepID=A0A653C229_CALMS|nr:unnamed protein product [Callosobruchus maculatus]